MVLETGQDLGDFPKYVVWAGPTTVLPSSAD